MSKIIKRAFALVLSVAMVLCLETSVFAASSTETDYSTAKVIAYNSGIAPASYVGFNSYSFTGSGRSSTINVDGTYMAYEYNITNSNSSYVTIETVVDGRVVQTNNVSGSGKIDWIPMGSSNSHSVQFRYTADSGSHSASISLTVYTW